MIHLVITISKDKYDIESLFYPDIQTLLCWKEWQNPIRITYGISKIMSLEYPKVYLLKDNPQKIEIEKKPQSSSEKSKEGLLSFSGFGQKKRHDETGLMNNVKIRIKFKEGCIKGVKRDVYLKDLL